MPGLAHYSAHFFVRTDRFVSRDPLLGGPHFLQFSWVPLVYPKEVFHDGCLGRIFCLLQGKGCIIIQGYLEEMWGNHFIGLGRLERAIMFSFFFILQLWIC